MDLLLKEAFDRIKEDINSLRDTIFALKDEVDQLRSSQEIIFSEIRSLKEYTANSSRSNPNIPSQKNQITPNYIIKSPFFSLANTQTIQTDNISLSKPISFFPTLSSTNRHKKSPPEAVKTSNPASSTGTEGVQTDRPTDKQTVNPSENLPNSSPELPKTSVTDSSLSEFEKANNILSSLDEVKKEIRLQFKSLTPQEMLVFSTLYTLEDQGIEGIDYSLLAKGIGLTESSIRDYIIKLMKKGIPIEKKRLNNKKILLGISSNLRNITNLNTILKLRDL